MTPNSSTISLGDASASNSIESSELTSKIELPKYRNLRYFAWALYLLVLGLILKGALVTSHDAGLAVPDWPTSFGENMFTFHPSKWHGIIFYEHVHRLYASLVGFLTVGLALWVAFTDLPRWLKWLAGFAVILVIAQGVLGGLTVLYLLPVSISSAHAVLGQTFLLVTLWIALTVSAYAKSPAGSPVQTSLAASDLRQLKKIKNLSIALLALCYLTLLAGAIMRHMGAGLAIPDFPTMGGTVLPWVTTSMVDGANALRASSGLPPVGEAGIWAHLLHRLGALGVFFTSLALILAILMPAKPKASFSHSGLSLPGSSTTFRIFAVAISALVLLQISLGISTVIFERPPWVASFHVAGGAVLLSVVFALIVKVFKGCKNSLSGS